MIFFRIDFDKYLHKFYSKYLGKMYFNVFIYSNVCFNVIHSLQLGEKVPAVPESVQLLHHIDQLLNLL